MTISEPICEWCNKPILPNQASVTDNFGESLHHCCWEESLDDDAFENGRSSD